MRGEDPFPTCDEEVHVVVYDPERAEPVCSKCGLVLDEMKFDFFVESNAVPKRKTTYPRTSRALKRSLKHQSLERNLQETFLKKCVQKLVQNKALELCHVVRKERFRAGYHVSTLSAALVYAAHRLCRVPVTLAECATTSATERKKIARCYNRLSRELELNVPRFESGDYLSRLVEKREIPDDTITLAGKILERAKEERLARGANPVGIVAAALYIAGGLTGHRFTQKQLARSASVSEVTVRASCKTLSGLLQTLPCCER